VESAYPFYCDDVSVVECTRGDSDRIPIGGSATGGAPMQPRTALRAGNGLRMEPAILRIREFLLTVGAHGETRHR
jgi:hypothetical protein